MSDLTPDEIRSRVHELSERIRGSENSEEWREYSVELVPLMAAYWDVHPHSAMEMLEVLAVDLPVDLAHPLIRTTVSAWKGKPTYDPSAGGSADHCYLSALILSENFDLADRPWVDEVLARTLEKETNYDRGGRMRDAERKSAFVRSLLG